ncbi:MAG: ABC transporter permease [Alphaproteobacteria bacterium]|nr:ABC transporter permease [Alphaproteobacteria bacterium]
MSKLRRAIAILPLRYLVQKLLLTVLLLWGVASLIFLLVELSPGTVADKYIGPDISPEQRDAVIAKFGLDQPGYVRYFAMMANLARFELGTSLVQERPVATIILEALPNTLLLSIVTLLVVYPFGIGLGIFQAVRQGTASDSAASLTSLFFYSMPTFWLALMLQLVAPRMGLPIAGMYDAVEYEYMTGWEQFTDRLSHILLPGVAMGLSGAAGLARYMRSSLLEVIRQDYVRTARAKGLPERVVIGRHALRNALLPIITLIGLSLPFLVGGSVLVETVFAWPGMGRLILDAIYQQDTPLITACFLLFALVVTAGNLVADLLYAVVDPRIRYA